MPPRSSSAVWRFDKDIMANNVPDSHVIEVVSVANNNVPAATGAEVVVDAEVVIGEPPEITDIDIQGSVCYTHRYFKKIAGTDTAVCLTCQRFNAKREARCEEKGYIQHCRRKYCR